VGVGLELLGEFVWNREGGGRGGGGGE
jgi:hypothetical protein